MSQHVWAIGWSKLGGGEGPSVNVVAPNIQAATRKGKRWLSLEENLVLNPEDCEMVSVVRGVEIG